jgi:hypothetical protein
VGGIDRTPGQSGWMVDLHELEACRSPVMTASATFGALGAAGHALMEGEAGLLLGVIGGVIGNNALARVLPLPATAASTAKWARAYNAVVNKPARPSLATFQTATRSLASTAAPQACANSG